MDWRLIAAVSGATGSFCLVAFGAYVVFTQRPPALPTAAPPPILVSGYRFAAVTTTPSLMRVQPPSPFAPGPSAPSPLARVPLVRAPLAPGPSAPGPSEPSPFAPGPLAPQAALPGSVTTDPVDAVRAPRGAAPLQPVVAVRKSSVVPELHAALPASRYRGVLTSAEIVRVKSSLRLSPEQERAWPAVEAALAEMGRQQIALIRRGQQPRISPSEWPPGRLYAAAGPLLQTLRPDQKETVRRLCRSLGFEGVASMI